LKALKNWKPPGEDNSNSELYKDAVGSFNERRLFFNNTYMMGEMPGECNKVLSYLYTRKVTNKRWKTTEELAYLMHVTNHIVKF
jgi:hypothetical protein